MTASLDLETSPTDTLRLRWGAPADEWVSATPVGNGRIGAMVFGGTTEARFQVNDATAWSGMPDGPARALDSLVAAGAGPERLAEVRAAVDAGDHRLAEQLILAFEGPYSQEFLPFADLRMSLAPAATQPPEDPPTVTQRGTTPPADLAGEHPAYERELDLDRGVVTERFPLGDAAVTRTTWVSRPAKALLVHLVSDRPLDVSLAVSTPLLEERRATTDDGLVIGLRLPVDGAPEHEKDVAEPLRYAESGSGFDPFGAVAVSVRSDGSTTVGDGRLYTTGATRLLVALTTDTNAAAWWQGAAADSLDTSHRDRLVASTLVTACTVVAQPADHLLTEHVADLGALLTATTVRIGERRTGSFDVATEVLQGGDDALTATVMLQLGRYLLASSSRPGGPPANLQGIWNEDLRPPWSSNYTVNINTEMNYWAAESAGLSECHLPLIDLVEKLSRTGAPAARQLYGARGWVTHHNTDFWAWPLPVGAGHSDPSWAIWMMGGLWLTDHVWQHWAFTLDVDYLRERAWPILCGAAEFALDWLVDGPDGPDGLLRTIPSTSPENHFRGPDGHPASLGESAAMDMALIRALFGRVIRASTVLGLDSPAVAEIEAVLPRLPEPGLSADGRMLEWGSDVEAVDPHHRHVSPMVAVYPFDQVTPEATPMLAAAAAATLDARGPGGMGWSWAWRIALRARLGDGEAARDELREAMAPFEHDPNRLAPVDGSEPGGLLPNLFSTHPPFQVDANYGFTAGILEMLVSSRDGVIHLLPALPRAWSEGEVRGVRVPGGLAVDFAWCAGRLSQLQVRRLTERAATEVVVAHGDRRWALHLTGLDAVELDVSSLVGA